MDWVRKWWVRVERPWCSGGISSRTLMVMRDGWRYSSAAAHRHTQTHTRRSTRLIAEGLLLTKRVIPVAETFSSNWATSFTAGLPVQLWLLWNPTRDQLVLRSSCSDDVATAPHMLRVTGELASFMLKEQGRQLSKPSLIFIDRVQPSYTAVSVCEMMRGPLCLVFSLASLNKPKSFKCLFSLKEEHANKGAKSRSVDCFINRFANPTH